MSVGNGTHAPVLYGGWLGAKGHEGDKGHESSRPYDPAATAAFNRAQWEREQRKANGGAGA